MFFVGLTRLVEFDGSVLLNVGKARCCMRGYEDSRSVWWQQQQLTRRFGIDSPY